MVKATQVKKYRYFDDESREHIEDYDLWLRMLNDGCICYTIEDRLFYYRDNSTSINHTKKSSQVERMALICNEMLGKSFNFRFDQPSFEILLAEGGKIDFASIKKINQEIIKYTSLIKEKYPLSKTAYNEMNLWRKQKVIVVTLKSFKQISIKAKISLLLFLASHLGWFTYKSVRTLIKRTIFTKYRNRV